MWTVYCDGKCWGALNYISGDPHDGAVAQWDMEMMDIASQIAARSSEDLIVHRVFHKLDFEEINFAIYYKKHCSSTRVAIVLRRESDRKVMMKMYVGMGLPSDRKEWYGVVTICRCNEVLCSLLAVLVRKLKDLLLCISMLV